MRSLSGLVLACGCGRVGFDAKQSVTTSDGPRLVIDAPVLALDAGECPPNYQSVDGSCYRVGAPNGSWLSDELACEADAVGAHLAAITTEPERAAVVAALGLLNDTWIGTSRRQIAAFRTVIDTAPYLDWGPGMGETSEDCISIDSDALMYMHSCTDLDRYFCEYDGIAAVPSTY